MSAHRLTWTYERHPCTNTPINPTHSQHSWLQLDKSERQKTACEQDMHSNATAVAACLRESMMATSTRAGRTDDEEDHYFVSRVRANPEESTELRAIARGAVAPAHHELQSCQRASNKEQNRISGPDVHLQLAELSPIHGCWCGVWSQWQGCGVSWMKITLFEAQTEL